MPSQNAFPLTKSVNSLLEKHALPTTLTIEQCANSLAMSMTSFRRKLSQEETTYKLIQNKFLNELCVQALLTNQMKIDLLAYKLGYSERATFERAFRNKFGVSPSQFRELSQLGNTQDSRKRLVSVAKNMPPLPDSCRMLLHEKEQDGLDVHRVVTIVGKDPVFVGRILGLASRAIYGRTPKTLDEAISRNLGINSVINLALIYSMGDSVTGRVHETIASQYTLAFLKAPKLFSLIRKSTTKKYEGDIALTEQILSLALLGVFLLCHSQASKHELMLYSLQGIADLDSLNQYVRDSMGVSIFSASSFMLSLWHLDAELIKRITHLDKLSSGKVKASYDNALLLFMLDCLYISAKEQKDYSELAQKAELLGIDDFSEIIAFLS